MTSGPPQRIPLVIKIAFTAFMAVLVPVYCQLYGVAVMLYFCDVALVLVLGAVWLESSLLVSMAAIMVLLGQLLWIGDVVTGGQVVGLAGYMFNPRYPLYARGLSLFHGWLPILMLWMMRRLGYDRRALAATTLLSWAILLVCYLFLPGPGAYPDDPLMSANVNYVYGLATDKPQEWMHPYLYLAVVMIAFPIVFYVPTHFALKALFRAPGAKDGPITASSRTIPDGVPAAAGD
jgi:hypothetical protein